MTATADWSWAPPQARPFIDAVVAAAQADPRIVGLTIGGSAAEGTMDEFSDLDFVVVCRDKYQPKPPASTTSPRSRRGWRPRTVAKPTARPAGCARAVIAAGKRRWRGC